MMKKQLCHIFLGIIFFAASTQLTHCAEEENRENQSGFSGWPWVYSFISSYASQIIYLLQNDLFNTQNQDHRNLIEAALTTCTDSQTLCHIIQLLAQKCPDEENLITLPTADKVHRNITAYNARFQGHKKVHNNYLSNTHLPELAAVLQDLDAGCKAATAQVNHFLSEYQRTQTEAVVKYHECKTTLLDLHQFCPDLTPQNFNGNCSDYDEDNELREYKTEDVTKKLSYPHRDAVMLTNMLTQLQEIQQKIDALAQMKPKY